MSEGIVEITPYDMCCWKHYPEGCPAVFRDTKSDDLLIIGKKVDSRTLDTDAFRGRIGEDETVIAVPAEMIFKLEKE